MLRKYNSFLLESQVNSILLEGNLSGTTDFIFKLKEISKSDNKVVSNIANVIIHAIDNADYISDYKLNQNYFDLVDSDDKVSFIQQNKLPHDFDVDDSPDLPYELPRNEIKIGKCIRYICGLLNIRVKDSDIENFVNEFKSSKPNTKLYFKLVKGDDIVKYYKEDKYYNSISGSLGGSCMSNMSKKIFDIYSKNPKKVKMLVLLDGDDKVHGRAIVWKLDFYPKGGSKYFMDRIYTNRDSDVLVFKKFAKEKSWMYKQINHAYFDSNVKFIYNNNQIFGQISVNIDGDFVKYPFVDTMCFLSKDKKSLSNISDKKCYMLHDTSGDRYRCDSCDGKVIVTYFGGDRFCDECSEGHVILGSMGIETKWNKKLKVK